MSKEVIVPENVHPASGYSHAIKAGNTIYVSGQVALNKEGKLVGKGDIDAQAAQAFENLKGVLEAAGATMEDIVKINTYATHYSWRRRITDVRTRYVKHSPAATFAVVVSLADPDVMVEIEAIAVVDDD